MAAANEEILDKQHIREPQNRYSYAIKTDRWITQQMLRGSLTV